MLRKKVESMFSTVDQMMNYMIKATGVNILEAIGGLDEEEAAMIIPACKIYTEAKEYSIEMAYMMDEQKIQMEQLLKMNDKLVKKVETMQKEQELLIKKIEKMERDNTCKCGKENARK